MIYTKEERDEQVAKMREVSNRFYLAAITTDVHAFLEFCGLMNKFIDICTRTSERGADFNEANTHAGEALAVEDHDIHYLAEKFDCIFGPTLADPQNRAIFFRAMGWPVGG